jgi:hypothetical protein
MIFQTSLNMDASKRIFVVAIGIIVFDFELFIGDWNALYEYHLK